MTTQTPNLDLTTFNLTGDKTLSFETYRTLLNGISNSNMTKIDDFAGSVASDFSAVDGRLDALEEPNSWYARNNFYGCMLTGGSMDMILYNGMVYEFNPAWNFDPYSMYNTTTKEVIIPRKGIYYVSYRCTFNLASPLYPVPDPSYLVSRVVTDAGASYTPIEPFADLDVEFDNEYLNSHQYYSYTQNNSGFCRLEAGQRVWNRVSQTVNETGTASLANMQNGRLVISFVGNADF